MYKLHLQHLFGTHLSDLWFGWLTDVLRYWKVNLLVFQKKEKSIYLTEKWNSYIGLLCTVWYILTVCFWCWFAVQLMKTQSSISLTIWILDKDVIRRSLNRNLCILAYISSCCTVFVLSTPFGGISALRQHGGDQPVALPGVLKKPRLL